MNLAAALKAAEKTASTVVGTSTLPCVQHRTGLLVLVYRTDTQEMLGQVQVSLSGRAIRLIPPCTIRTATRPCSPRAASCATP
ncbi:hypothetical protein MYXA107069_25605 [Myxococcus xanthus]|nr:hypothetical protein MyxoNM_32065 [Myxococcus xanthus]SDY24223.1 hypothetical protein SAMN05444383_1277 [Myxococcus xanthus]